MNDLYKEKQDLEDRLNEVKEKINHARHNSKSFLTVGGLRDCLDGIPDNTPVFCQLLEDRWVWKDKTINMYDGNGGKSDYHPAWDASFNSGERIVKINLIY